MVGLDQVRARKLEQQPVALVEVAMVPAERDRFQARLASRKDKGDLMLRPDPAVEVLVQLAAV